MATVQMTEHNFQHSVAQGIDLDRLILDVRSVDMDDVRRRLARADHAARANAGGL